MCISATDSKPFILQLVPLSFTDDLILQLLLAQSSAHRAVLEEDVPKDTATRHYTKSLSLCRRAINHYIDKSQELNRALAAGTLILCFTEVCIERFAPRPLS